MNTIPSASPVYLDHAATTPMYAEAVDVMTEQMQRPGNASSLHAFGRAARRVVEESREQIAAALSVRPSDVIFTSGGTEADNLAVKGIFWSRRAADPKRNRILSTPIEHHAVLDALFWLEEEHGAEIELIAVDTVGRIDLGALEACIARDPATVALVSAMWANNEVGTVQPVADVAAIAHAAGVPAHTDAVQAVGQLPLDVTAAGVDALTLTAHKLGGPYGVGCLVARRDLALTPLLHGGGQERDVRSGTLDVPAIAAFATAVGIAVNGQAERAARVAALRDDLVSRMRLEVPEVVVNGDPRMTLDHRLPGNAHLTFPGCAGDSLLMLLDARGIACSTGSACSAGVPQASHVLLAMGCGPDEARSSLRFSLGHTSTQADVDSLVAAIGPAVQRARAAGLASGAVPATKAG